MRKGVIFSINPVHVRSMEILEKKFEVRKIIPKIEFPFNAYIYCTTNGYNDLFRNSDVTALDREKWSERKGKVVGEFVCDYSFEIVELNEIHTEVAGNPIERWHEWNDAPEEIKSQADIEKATCLSFQQIVEYMGNKGIVSCLHISDLKMYEQPKDLSDFKPWHRECKYSDLGLAIPDCWTCHACKMERPPQSWCYVDITGDAV